MSRPAINDLVQKNVDTIARIEQAAEAGVSPADRVAMAISSFVGQIEFVWAQLVFVGLWITTNTVGFVPPSARFDPYPFHMLILTLAVQTIIMTTFILISQNRERLISERRNHLDLQVNLLAEQEASQMLAMLQKMMARLGVDLDQPEVDALREATDPEKMLNQIDASLKKEKDGAAAE